MSSQAKPAPTPAVPFGADRDLHRVLWLTLALFLSYLCVAISLPVISVFVTTGLGLGNGFTGLAVGVTFGSTILTRGVAGKMADHQGSKVTMTRGLWAYALAGSICAFASFGGFAAPVAYAILIVGRLLLGVGESLTVAGEWCWGSTCSILTCCHCQALRSAAPHSAQYRFYAAAPGFAAPAEPPRWWR